MSQISDLKKAIDNISNKQHVLSKEARYAKEQLDIQDGQKATQLSDSAALMHEFNISISLLQKVFAQSRFDEVMGFIAQPLRLILLNFLLAFFKGIGFVCGGSLIAFFIWNLVKDYV